MPGYLESLHLATPAEVEWEVIHYFLSLYLLFLRKARPSWIVGGIFQGERKEYRKEGISEKYSKCYAMLFG